MAGGADEKESAAEAPIFRDIRRYYCDLCGICRSKKSLIRSHVLSQHQDEMQDAKTDESCSANTCPECGASFRKPAYLKQHMQSHSLEDLGLSNDENDTSYLDITREALDPM